MNQSLLELIVGIRGENEITQGVLRVKKGCTERRTSRGNLHLRHKMCRASEQGRNKGKES